MGVAVGGGAVLQDGQVTTPKLATNAAVTSGTVSANAAFSTSSTTYVDITGIALVKTMTVKATLALGAVAGCYTSGAISGYLAIFEGAAELDHTMFSNAYAKPVAMHVLFDSTTGSQTYKLRGKTASGTAYYSNTGAGQKRLTVVEFKDGVVV